MNYTFMANIATIVFIGLIVIFIFILLKDLAKKKNNKVDTKTDLDLNKDIESANMAINQDNIEPINIQDQMSNEEQITEQNIDNSINNTNTEKDETIEIKIDSF